ncbi:peptide-methionine (R)-S-oxide reductase MsrB [Stella sp.]|uniref:peptide-methionine (R)-S-oxide reductase MsrB n=1 Tax=Stella sp. TaxID=2912054 RepID=UPI0035ADAF2A
MSLGKLFGRAHGAPASLFPVAMAEEDWRRCLAPDAFRVLREHGTEPPHSSPLDGERRPGRFLCAGCGQPLFDAADKFDGGTGWPSFCRPLECAVGRADDGVEATAGTEVHCANCGGHLGHVFADGPPPTGLRYCVNGVAMTFEPQAAEPDPVPGRPACGRR